MVKSMHWLNSREERAGAVLGAALERGGAVSVSDLVQALGQLVSYPDAPNEGDAEILARAMKVLAASEIERLRKELDSREFSFAPFTWAALQQALIWLHQPNWPAPTYTP